MKNAALILVLAGVAFGEEPDPRYPELSAAERGDADKFGKLEELVNAVCDEDDKGKRDDLIKEVEKAGFPFKVVEAVLRHGRHYVKTEERFAHNIVVPQSYDPAKSIPVLVGFNGLTEGWEREASTRGFATVMPWNIAAWVDPRTGDRVAEQLWEASREVNIDFDRIYATGVSVGGHAVWISAATRTDMWAAMLPVSGSPGRILVAMSEVYLNNPKWLPIRTTVGEDDEDIMKMAKKGQEVAKRFEIPSTLDVVPGKGHESFDDRAENLLSWAAEMRRQRYPPKLDWWGGGDLGWHHYWVEVLEEDVQTKDMLIESVRQTYTRQIPIQAFHVQAEVNGNSIKLNTKRVKRLRILLSPAMVDFDEEVTIKLNGQELWKGKPEPSVRTLLEMAVERHDRSRTFAWKKDVSCE